MPAVNAGNILAPQSRSKGTPATLRVAGARKAESYAELTQP